MLGLCAALLPRYGALGVAAAAAAASSIAAAQQFVEAVRATHLGLKTTLREVVPATIASAPAAIALVISWWSSAAGAVLVVVLAIPCYLLILRKSVLPAIAQVRSQTPGHPPHDAQEQPCRKQV
jgi:hypothetical protein